MIPRTIIPEALYRDAFRAYVYGLALHWLGMEVQSADVGDVRNRIAETAAENHRATYLRYMLPYVNSRFGRGRGAGSVLRAVA